MKKTLFSGAFGFSLMEMMVVMLIAAIIAAFTAPMVNKKMVRSASGESPWSWVGNNGNITYGFAGNAVTAAIGATTAPNLGNNIVPRLYIQDAGNPQITLGYDNNANHVFNVAYRDGLIWMNTGLPYQLDDGQWLRGVYINTTAPVNTITDNVSIYAGNVSSHSVGIGCNQTGTMDVAIGMGAISSGNSVAIGNSADGQEPGTVVIGAGARSDISAVDAISIGNNSLVSSNDHAGTLGISSIAIGAHAQATGDGAVAIGSAYQTTSYAHPTDATDYETVAIGSNAHARGLESVAIGSGTFAEGSNSVAIGHSATTQNDNEIELGSNRHTVHIPGNLVVDGDVFLGHNNNARVFIRGSSNRILMPFDIGVGNLIMTGGSDFNFNVGEYSGTARSDRRLKNVGAAFKGGLAEIRKLEVFNYTFKDDKAKTPRVGVMAQDLKKIFPNAVFKGEDGFYRIRMEDMFYAIINAIKELDRIVTSHDKRIEALEEENRALVVEINELKARLDKLEKVKK